MFDENVGLGVHKKQKKEAHQLASENRESESNPYKEREQNSRWKQRGDFEKTAVDTNEFLDFLDTEFLLLILILLTFFQRADSFSEKFDLLSKEVEKIQNYLDTANSTLETLNQASQIPKQNLS